MSNSESDEFHPTDITTSQRDDEEVANYSQPTSVPDITASNVGMLFIISAQFFSACMYASVKILNSLETPVHALQVSCFLTFGPLIGVNTT
jgi:hypothetical protein